MVLCYSRMLYVEFTVSQTMEHFLACHQHAFDFFGGIPHKVMVDNLKSAVLKRAGRRRPRTQSQIPGLCYASRLYHCPCNVGKGNEKGRVENGVGYIKKNFLEGLEMPAFSALNPAAWQWRDTVANVRLHGEDPGATDRLVAYRAAVFASPPAPPVRYRYCVPGARFPTISHYR